MEYIFIYLLQIFNLVDLLFAFLCITDIGLIIFWLILGFCTRFEYTNYKNNGSYCDLTTETGQNGSKLCKKLIPIMLIITFFVAIIPSRQTLLLMGGTYLGKKAVKQIITDKKLEKVNTIIELELDKRIKELKEN